MAEDILISPTDPRPLTKLEGLNERIDWDRRAYLRYNKEPLTRFRQYVNGEHARILTDKQKVILENLLDNVFCDNVCHDVVSNAADRLAIKSIGCPTKEDIAEYLKNFYITANVEDIAGSVHYDTLTDGNHALGCFWDFQRKHAKLTPVAWWTPEERCGIFIAYDDMGSPTYAVREWYVSDTTKRRVVYWPDKWERFISTDGGTSWQYYTAKEANGIFRYTTEDGIGLGIPFVHFSNAGRGSKRYGYSELHGGVLGFQDQINDIHYDLSAAGRFTGFQQMYFTGVETHDENNQPIPGRIPEVGPGNVFTSPNPDAKAGAIPAGSIQPLIDLYITKLNAIARMTRTPMPRITGGDWPSGEALLRTEMPATFKAERQIAKFIVAWSSIGYIAVKLANRYGKQNFDLDALVRAEFYPPDRRDALSKSVIVANLGTHISTREALRLMNYTGEKAQEIYEEIQEELKYDSEMKALIRSASGATGGADGTPANPTKADEPQTSGGSAQQKVIKK